MNGLLVLVICAAFAALVIALVAIADINDQDPFGDDD